MTAPILSLRGLSKQFGPVTAADRVDLDLYEGEVLALLGENGAGKTTLMNMLFGHYAPDAGSVVVRGVDGDEVVLPPGDAQAAIDQRIGMSTSISRSPITSRCSTTSCWGRSHCSSCAGIAPWPARNCGS